MGQPYVLNKTSDDSAEMLIYDVIGESFWEEGVTAKRFAKDLKALGKVKLLNIRINSPGGDVFHGNAIYNSLKQYETRKIVHIDGLAASMASVIAMAGDEIRIASNALVMIHNPVSLVRGDAAAMRRRAELLDKVKENTIDAYASQSGLEKPELSKMMDEETWMTAKEALEKGFVDVISEEVAVAASISFDDVTAMLHVPDAYREKLAGIVKCKKPENNPMPETNEPTRVPATIEQLESLNGATPEFVLSQLKAKATLPEATNSLNAALFDQLQKAKQTPPPSQPTQQAALPEQPSQPLQQAAQATFGANPISSQQVSGNQGVPPVDKPWSSNPLAFYRDEMRRLKNEGMPAIQAAAEIDRRHPGLREALQAV